MKQHDQISIKIRGLRKKFTHDVFNNMLYGTVELFLPKGRNNDQLRKKEFWALDSINLDFYKGDICAIIGSNGSGKTTLMRVISDIYGHEIGSLNTYGNKITPIFAVKAGLNPVLTGNENIDLLGSIYGMTKEEIELKRASIKEFSELGDSLTMPCGNYSSGMKSRLGYSIAAATNPDIFIIDEALAVGDVYFREKCMMHIENLAESGKTILFVTNNHLKVEKVANRVVVMKFGKILLDTYDTIAAMDYYSSPEYRSLKKSEV